MRVFADKAVGYGIPGITIDGTDPDAIAAAFAWAAERARGGRGPDADRDSSRCACAATRTTTTCCISARIRSRRGTTRRSTEQGYADRELYEFWAARDPIATYAARLEARRASSRPGDLERFKRDAEAIVEERGARGDRRAVARCRRRRARRVRRRAAAGARRGARSGGPAEADRPSTPARLPTDRRAGTAVRSAAAGRSSKR